MSKYFFSPLAKGMWFGGSVMHRWTSSSRSAVLLLLKLIDRLSRRVLAIAVLEHRGVYDATKRLGKLEEQALAHPHRRYVHSRGEGHCCWRCAGSGVL